MILLLTLQTLFQDLKKILNIKHLIMLFSPLSKLLSKIFWDMRRKKTVSEFLLVQKRTVYSKRLFKQEKLWKSWKMFTDYNNKKMNWECMLESGTYYSSHWDFELFFFFKDNCTYNKTCIYISQMTNTASNFSRDTCTWINER